MTFIWHFICLLFFLININILINESYELIYKIINQKEPAQYLNCVNLNEIIINKSRINLNEIKQDLNYSLKWIQKNKKSKYGNLILNETINKVVNQIELKNYFIYRNRICFILSNENEFRTFYFSLNELPELNLINFLFNKDTFSFSILQDPDWGRLYCQIITNHIEYPYSSCSKDYSNFKCLNNKIKRIYRLSRYYYGSDENGSIELDYQINQTIIDNEIKIIKQCNQIDCKINIFQRNTDFNIDTIILKSFLYIPKFDFYFQLIGLIVLFLNIPVYELIIKLINFERCKKILKFFNRKYFKLNYLIKLIITICLLSLFGRSIYNFIEERDYPPMQSISVNSIESELSIVICVDTRMIKGNDYNIYNRSLLELENDTNNGLNIALKDIYLQFLNEKIPVKWQLESKLIVFKYLDRCFQLKIFINIPKYQMIFSITKLIIKLNQYSSSIYILTDNELFNSKSYKHFLPYNFRKRIFERSKLNQIKKCKDFNLVDDNCISKWNCIDKCVNMKIYNQLKNLTAFSYIDKESFTDEEWSNLFIKPDSSYNFQIGEMIKKECEDKYLKLDPCIDIKFERKSIINQNFDKRKVIDLNYEVIYYKEDEVSIFKLLLDLLNIQINLFGLNFHKLSFMILSLLKLRLIKMFKLLIYLICSLSFMYHLWSIYDEIINIQTIYSEHYELINSIHTPDLIFCFDFNHTKLINQNYKLTYEHLDNITSDELIEDKIFQKIEYLNQSNNWIKLDNKTNFKDNNLEIRIFYYLDRKCFKIIQNIKYNRNQFEFNDNIGDDDLILKLFLNTIYLDNKIFYFFTKTNNKIQFSKITDLNLKESKNQFKSFKIKHELIKRDQFELIRNPLSSLLSLDDQYDLDKFFRKFMNYFEKELNLVTIKLPFEKTNSNLQKELDDDLFIQLYNQQSDLINSNHLKQHSNNYFEIFYFYSNLIPNLEFSLSFYRKVIVVSNKISLIKLIINLLNVLSFWFNLGILDLHIFLYKIKLLPVQFYKLLIKIKNKLLPIIL